MTPTLHILGCGRVGRVLARLWRRQATFDIGWVVNRGAASARTAVAFIGAGQAGTRPGPVAPGDWLMLALPDGELAPCAARLARALDHRPALAFHVSGAEPAALLEGLGGADGTRVAAVHPVCPFSDPERALDNFAGSPALGEGDAGTLARVLPCFAAIGARPATFRPVDKRLYHAATIAASNFLNVLDQLALDLAGAGGLDGDTALEVITALQRTALDNIARLGPAAALTGPVERADVATCRRLQASLETGAPAQAALFGRLAEATVALARQKHAGRDYPVAAVRAAVTGDAEPG